MHEQGLNLKTGSLKPSKMEICENMRPKKNDESPNKLCNSLY